MSQLPEPIAALIPGGLRPEIAHGIALWLGGASTLRAAREAGCPQQTLWSNIQRLPEEVRAGRSTMAKAVQAIAYPVMQEAYKQLQERLLDPEAKPLSAMELNVIAGTAADKTINAQRVIQGTDTGTGSPLEALLGKLGPAGGTVTMSIEPNTVIDVTPVDEQP